MAGVLVVVWMTVCDKMAFGSHLGKRRFRTENLGMVVVENLK